MVLSALTPDVAAAELLCSADTVEEVSWTSVQGR